MRIKDKPVSIYMREEDKILIKEAAEIEHGKGFPIKFQPWGSPWVQPDAGPEKLTFGLMVV